MKTKIKIKAVYLLNNNSDTDWKSLKEIEDWAKENNYGFIRTKKQLIVLTKKGEIVIYEPNKKCLNQK